MPLRFGEFGLDEDRRKPFSADGRTFGYNYSRGLSNLYLISGLK